MAFKTLPPSTCVSQGPCSLLIIPARTNSADRQALLPNFVPSELDATPQLPSLPSATRVKLSTWQSSPSLLPLVYDPYFRTEAPAAEQHTRPRLNSWFFPSTLLPRSWPSSATLLRPDSAFATNACPIPPPPPLPSVRASWDRRKVFVFAELAWVVWGYSHSASCTCQGSLLVARCSLLVLFRLRTVRWMRHTAPEVGSFHVRPAETGGSRRG